MATLKITITKGAQADIVAIDRGGGQSAQFSFPKKGSIPHDFVHLAVEQAFGFKRGFWGMVAAGADPAAIQDIAKAGGHASATRRQTPDPSIVELIQAERLVECFEAEFWSSPTDLETFRDIAAAACSASLAPTPELRPELVEATRARIAAFAKQWIEAPLGAQFDFTYS